MRSQQRQQLPQADADSLCRSSACGLYLYLALHANGSCETSQTFFPTVTFHQSGRGTRGPREDGSWSAPSHWLFDSSSWRPMARGPGSGQSQENRLHPSIITPFTSERCAPPPAADTGPFMQPTNIIIPLQITIRAVIIIVASRFITSINIKTKNKNKYGP